MSPRARTLAALIVVLGGMTALTSYSVTLYRLFCQVTGANGTTRRVARDDAQETGRWITVRFDTSVSPGLPWRFAPAQPLVRARLGQDTLVFFTAENLSEAPITGHATFNVTPEKAGLYFKKIQCFCFSEERLAPHARAEMPVDFYVDPALARDPATRDVNEITLAYTFFRSAVAAPPRDLARFAAAPPDPAAGARLFAQDCAACHAADRNGVGPALGGLAGRKAGAAPGYAYSAALREAGFTWDVARLDRWLAGPAALVPGTRMPAHVDTPIARRDIAAYVLALPKPGS